MRIMKKTSISKTIFLLTFFTLLLSFSNLAYSRGILSGNAGQLAYKEITHNGLQRTYCEFVPTEIEGMEGKCPLVIVLHGGGGTGEYMALLTRFNQLARLHKFVVVYPDGWPAGDQHWNDGRDLEWNPPGSGDIDDVGFISALIDQLATEYPIDLDRVYVTGISNGALMTHRLATDISTKIAAAAMVAGNISETYYGIGVPSAPVPMIIMNGTEDKQMPWNGGDIGLGAGRRGRAVSTEQTVNFWRRYNECETPAKTVYKPDIAPDDGTRVRVDSYADDAGKIMVMLYAIIGGGHTWPGVPQYISKEIVGRTSFDINGTDEIYNFFEQHSRVNQPPQAQGRSVTTDEDTPIASK